MTAAFLTGGSGFIGGRLIERLRGEGHGVRALARSDAAAERVRERGAEPVRGDLSDVAAMRAGADGCELAFHAAATLGDWGRREDFERGNVEGTDNVLRAAREAGVRRFVHVGTEAALMAGQPLVEVDETVPLRPDSPALYSATKARAEQAVLAANSERFETVVVRPRFVWGLGDTTLLPVMVGMVRAGRFAWIGGGRHLTSTTHVDNTVEGLILGATAGQCLLRHRRRAGRLPRLRRTAARDPGGSRSHEEHSHAGRGAARGRRGGRLARASAARPPSADALHLLGVLAGVHDPHRQGEDAARLSAAEEHRRRPRRARRLTRTPRRRSHRGLVRTGTLRWRSRSRSGPLRNATRASVSISPIPVRVGGEDRHGAGPRPGGLIS